MCHEHADGKAQSLLGCKDEFELVGIVDDRTGPSPDVRRTDFSAFDGIPRITEEEALNDPSIEAILVEVRNKDLIPTSMRVASHGKPMHMDKPTGETLAPFIELAELCKDKKIHLQLGFMFRGNPAVRFTQKAAKEGWLGDILSVEADMNHCYGGEGYQNYLSTFPAGILYTLGCHLVDLIMPMMPGVPLRAHTIKCTAPGDRPGIANNCVSVLEWEHATATIHVCSRAMNAQPLRRLRVLGSKGYVEICPIERFDGEPEVLSLNISEPHGGYEAGTHVIEFAPRKDRYIDQLRELKQIVRGEIPDPDNCANDIAVHKTVLMMCGYN